MAALCITRGFFLPHLILAWALVNAYSLPGNVYTDKEPFVNSRHDYPITGDARPYGTDPQFDNAPSRDDANADPGAIAGRESAPDIPGDNAVSSSISGQTGTMTEDARGRSKASADFSEIGIFSGKQTEKGKINTDRNGRNAEDEARTVKELQVGAVTHHEDKLLAGEPETSEGRAAVGQRPPRHVNSAASNRGKRSYDEAYLQSIGYDPLMAWKAKRYDDSYMQSLGYDPSMAWGGKRFDDSYMESIGYDPAMMWGNKRYDDAFLQSVGYDPTMAWGRKRYDDAFLQSVGYDPTMAWGKRHDGNDDYNLARLYRNYKNLRNKDTQMKDEDDEGEIEIPETYFRQGEIDAQPTLTKRSTGPRLFIGVDDYKRSPSEMGPRGFHEGIFNDHFGYFSPVKRSKRNVEEEPALSTGSEIMNLDYNGEIKDIPVKRKFGMGSRGFYGDTFSNGFGDFTTMKKRYNDMTSSGFHGDTFSGGFGDFGTMKKRYNDMTSSGFYGDTFSGGFGDFGTMKKRYHGMTSSGFHGDTFSGGFGDFGTMKKRYHGMTSSGFHGDTFSGGFGDFGTMKKRFPVMTPADYRRAVINHRLVAMLNNPEALRENVKESTEGLDRNQSWTGIVPRTTDDQKIPSSGVVDSR